MPRPVIHAAIRPFKITRSAIEAHQGHAPTPFMGCPLCIVRSPMQPLDIRWTTLARAA